MLYYSLSQLLMSNKLTTIIYFQKKVCIKINLIQNIFKSMFVYCKCYISIELTVFGKLPQRKIAPGQCQGLAWDQRQNQGWGAIFLGGNFPRTRIDVFEGIDIIKTSASEDQYQYFLNYSFKFQPNVCNRSHDLLMMQPVITTRI